jgi:hypothetical protein
VLKKSSPWARITALMGQSDIMFIFAEKVGRKG